MGSALDVHRLHFAFTVTFHYLFPQLTMGLALLIVILKTMACARATSTTIVPLASGRKFSPSISPWAWSPAFPWNSSSAPTGREFSKAAGGVIGQTLAMEGVFSFFLESQFPGPVSLRRKAPWPASVHWLSAVLVFCRLLALRLLHRRHRRLDAASRRLSHPGPTGQIGLASFWGLLLNPWALWQ